MEHEIPDSIIYDMIVVAVARGALLTAVLKQLRLPKKRLKRLMSSYPPPNWDLISDGGYYCEEYVRGHGARTTPKFHVMADAMLEAWELAQETQGA